jgi:hypothetical protein
MQYIINITDIIYYILAILNVVYELPDGRDVPKDVGVVKYYKDILSLVYLFGFINEYFK